MSASPKLHEAPDPVFAAIELLKSAMAENDRLAKAEIGGNGPGADLSQARLDRAGSRWSALFAALLATVPATPAGLVAMMDFIAIDFLREWLGGDSGLDEREVASLTKTVQTFAMEIQCAR